MSYSLQSASSLPSTWLELNGTAIECTLAVTFLLLSVAAATGDPETMALFALVGFAVVLLGLTFVRLSEHFRTNGTALP